MADSKDAPAKGHKGSQKWLRIAVNSAPDILNREMAPLLPAGTGLIEWLSPMANDKPAYCEYRDSACLKRLGIVLEERPLASYWPNRGPMWDALARTQLGGDLLLVEAKAHIPEVVSTGARAGEVSAAKIKRSLEETRRALAPKSQVSWSGTFYQYANRLAHLYLLRELNGLKAHLVFLYFLNADDVGGPASRDEWIGATRVVETYLGVGRHRLSPYIHKVFVDVNELRAHA